MSDFTLIQTYNPDDPALVAAATGKVKEFWEQELTHRKQFSYPPFTKLIKLTYRNRDARIAQRVAQDVATKFTGSAYPAFIYRERGQYIWNVLLKIKDPRLTVGQENSKIKTELAKLPNDWIIDVDPISIV